MQCEHMIWKHTGSRTLDWSACFWLQKKTKTLSSFNFRLKCLKLHDAYPCISMHIQTYPTYPVLDRHHSRWTAFSSGTRSCETRCNARCDCDLSCLLDPYRFFRMPFLIFSVSCWVILLGSAWCDDADDACRNSWWWRPGCTAALWMRLMRCWFVKFCKC